MRWPGDRRGLSRRALLARTVAGTGIAAGAALLTGSATTEGTPGRGEFHGARQDGITTAPLPFLSFAGFDLTTSRRDDLVRLLQTWTRAAAELSAVPSGAVSVTFGFGPSLFGRDGLGLAGARPPALVPLPSFPGDAINPADSDGDLGVQVCASHPSMAHEAVRRLVEAGRGHAALRWRHTGFRDAGHPRDPYGLFGFRDGTANLNVDDPAETAEQLWVDDGPRWLHGGTYLVVRRIRLLLDTWDQIRAADQEAVVGRRRETNLRFAAPPTAHTRLASPAANNGLKVLRRSFSYEAGVDPNGLMDSGLIFICFQRDPRQFVTIQRRLAAHDALNGFSQHLASGLFACPPGAARGSWIGAQLLS